MQTPAARSTTVAGAILLRDRGLLLPALLLPASCSDCSRFVALDLEERVPAAEEALIFLGMLEIELVRAAIAR